MDRAREHLLAGAGFACEEHREGRGADTPGDADDLVDRLRDPDDVGIPFERLGGPEGRALLLVAAVAVEGQARSARAS
jgi:hypothetical protein